MSRFRHPIHVRTLCCYKQLAREVQRWTMFLDFGYITDREFLERVRPLIKKSEEIERWWRLEKFVTAN